MPNRSQTSMATWVDAAAFPTSMLQNSRSTMISVPLWIQILNPRIQGSHITFDSGILTELQELLLAHHPILRQIHRLKPGSFSNCCSDGQWNSDYGHSWCATSDAKDFKKGFRTKKGGLKKKEKKVVDLKHHMKSVSSKDGFLFCETPVQ